MSPELSSGSSRTLSDNSFKRRARKPKVKSGCRTCKLRRVKCDETKPACIRCLKYWGSCDGYSLDTTQPEPLAISPPALQTRQTLLQPRIGPRFEDGQEHRYFEVFYRDTVSMLGGPFDKYIWASLIPQICEQEPFVLDAMIALGALTKTLTDVQRIRKMGIAPKDGELCLTLNSDHQNALIVYERALKGMQKASVGGGRGVRIALISCLLVVCFEGLYAHPVQALTHAQSGVKLMQQWLKENRRPGDYSLCSPAPDIIEDELISAFNRLDLQILTYFDTRPVELHQSSKTDTEKALRGMPSIFLSMKQARTYFDLIMKRTCHFLLTALHAGKADEMEAIGARIKSEGAVDLPGGINSFSVPKEVPYWMAIERDSYLEEVFRWTSAYDPLLKSIDTPDQNRVLGVLGGKTLKMMAITAKIMLSGAFLADEIGYDSFLPDFEEIFRLAESIYEPLIAKFSDKVSFHFDPHVLPPLFLLLSRCRDRLLRRKAIRLLTSSFHREGPWDSLAMARTGNWLMLVEEEGVDVEIIPDHRRARMTRFHVDSHHRQIQCRCYQRLAPGDPEIVWKEVVLRW